MNKQAKIIAVAGASTCGKNSLVNIFKKYLDGKNQNIKYVELSFAAPLKLECSDFIYRRFGIDIFNCSGEQKEIIRPLLVAYAKIVRKTTNNQYFIKVLEEKISQNIHNNNFIFITDLRFYEDDSDEVSLIRKCNGKIIHITRRKDENSCIQPSNEEEKQNDPKIKSIADFQLMWPSIKSEKDRYRWIIETRPEIFNYLS